MTFDRRQIHHLSFIIHHYKMLRHILTLIWNRKGKNALIIAEIFFAFLILFSVLTFVLYNLNNYREPLGFETEQLWLSHLDFEGRDSLEIVQTKISLKQNLLAHPNIEGIAFSRNSSPFGNSQSMYGSDDNGFLIQSHLYRADVDFKEVAGVNLIAGRWFREEDAQAKYRPIIINKKLHEKYFDSRPVLDSIFTISREGKIVGIVDHFKYMGQFEEEVPSTFFYEPKEAERSNTIYFRLKDGVGVAFEEELSNTIAQIGKFDDVLIEQIENRRKQQNKSVWVPIVVLLSICGFLIFNVALGLFGVLWYNISKRKAEIGLRRVLGAFRSSIAQQFIVEILLVAFIGILLGAVFSVQVPLLSAIEIDPKFFYQAIGLAALLILSLVVICAVYPSQQAAGIAPAAALHEE